MAIAQMLTTTLDGVKEWVEATIAPELEYLVPPDDGAVDGVEVERANPSVFQAFVPAAERMPAGAHHAPSIAVQFPQGNDVLADNSRELTIRLVLTIWSPGRFVDGQFIRDSEGWRGLINGLGVMAAAIESAETIAGSTVDQKAGVQYGYYQIDKEIPDLYPYWIGTVDFKLIRAPHSNKRFKDLL